MKLPSAFVSTGLNVVQGFLRFRAEVGVPGKRLGDLVDIARAECDDNIARSDLILEPCDDIVQVTQLMNTGPGVSPDRLNH
jgi:hypothetical protein